jgi:hypothetical protein
MCLVNIYFDFFSTTAEPVLAKVGTNHPWLRVIRIIQMKDNPFLQGEIIAKE